MKKVFYIAGGRCWLSYRSHKPKNPVRFRGSQPLKTHTAILKTIFHKLLKRVLYL